MQLVGFRLTHLYYVDLLISLTLVHSDEHEVQHHAHEGGGRRVQPLEHYAARVCDPYPDGRGVRVVDVAGDRCAFPVGRNVAMAITTM